MAEAVPTEIPKRALFKASEVCELMQVQPYVLRTWEAEFPALGISKGSGPRVYRRSDVEQVARIKHLLMVDGLTLAGARRRIEEETAPVQVDEPAIHELLGQNARERLSEVKRGLRSILDLLSQSANSPNRLRFEISRPAAVSSSPRGSGRSKPARGKATAPARKNGRKRA